MVDVGFGLLGKKLKLEVVDDERKWFGIIRRDKMVVRKWKGWKERTFIWGWEVGVIVDGWNGVGDDKGIGSFMEWDVEE